MLSRSVVMMGEDAEGYLRGVGVLIPIRLAVALLILNDPNAHTIEEDQDETVEMMVLNQCIRNEVVGLEIDHNLDHCKDRGVRTTLGAPVIPRGG